MASDEPSGPRPATPIVLRIKLRYDDVEVMVLRFAANVGKSGLFLPTRSLQPIGAEVKFELRLADDTPALVGLGRVKAATPPDPQNPRATFGIAVELMRVTPQSRALILRMLERRRAAGLPELGLPTAADIDAARRADAVEPAGRELDSGPVQVTPPSAAASVAAAPVAARARAAVGAALAPAVAVASPVEPEAASAQAPASPAAMLPAMASAPAADAAAGELLLTSPRRTTGAMAVAKVVAIAPLAPEPARRRRMPVGELIERASGPVAGAAIQVPGLAGLDADVDVAAAIARARALAGGPADAELDALCESISVPLEISVDAASAELARQLGGTPVRRDRGAAWAPPPATAAGTGSAGAIAGPATAAEAAEHGAPAEEAERGALADDAAGADAAEAAEGAAPAEAAARGAPAEEAARGASAEDDQRGALADDAEGLAAAQLAERAVVRAQADEDRDAAMAADVGGDAAAAGEAAAGEAEHAHLAAAGSDAEHAHPADDVGGDAEHGDPADVAGDDAEHADPVAAAEGAEHAYGPEAAERAAPPGAAGPGPQHELANSLAPLTLAQADLALELPDDAPARDQFSELDSDEHTEMGETPVAGGFEPPGGVDGVPELAALAEPVDGADEFEDFEILAEADAEDEDLLAAHGEHDASSRRALDGNLAPEGRRPSELDFAARLDLGDESDLYYAQPSDEFATHHVPDHITDDVIASLHDEVTGEHAGLDRRQPDGRALSSAGAALAAFETADEPLDDDAGSGDPIPAAPRPAGVRPIFEPEPSGTFTLAGIPADSIDVDAPPPRNLAHGEHGREARPERAAARPERAAARPERAVAGLEPAVVRGAPPSLHEAPMDEDELEHALEALDVDLDDLAIPHAADRARVPSRPAAARPAPAVIRPAPAAVRAAPSAGRPAPRAVRPGPAVGRPAPAPRGPFPPSRGSAPSPSRPARSTGPLAAGPGRVLPPRVPNESSVDIEIDDDDER